MLTRQIIMAPPQQEIVVPAAMPSASLIAATPAAAFLWRCELRRGEASGVADLGWQPDGSHFQARLEHELAGRELAQRGRLRPARPVHRALRPAALRP